MFGKKYSSIPNDKVVGMDVNTLTGFLLTEREWLAFIITLQLVAENIFIYLKYETNLSVMWMYVVGMMGIQQFTSPCF